MKKILLILLAALLIPVFAVAQSPEGRLPKTVVADVLAQMPAKNVDIYNQMMTDLIESGVEGLTILTDGMNPKGDNTAVGFAIGGLSYYVMTPGKTAERQKVQGALIKALEKVSDRELKAFFIRQLQIVGDDGVLGTLQKYAAGKELSEEAVAAIVEIGSPAAIETIEELVPVIANKSVAAFAAGHMGLSSQEKLVQSWLGTSDLKLQKASLDALSRMGGESSLPMLRKAATAIGLSYEPTGATESYLRILARFPNQKELASLLKNSDPNIRSSAIQIIAQTSGKEVLPYALKAIEDANRPYRNAALDATAPYADEQFYGALTAKLPEASTSAKTRRPANPESTVDIINFLGKQKAKSAVEKIITFINAPDAEQRAAAVTSLTRMDDPRGAAALIAGLSTSDAAQTALIKEALLWYKTNQNKALIAAMPASSELGKVAIVEILAAKNATESVAAIIDLTSSKGELGKAAYAALSTVSTEKELDKLCTMLEKGEYTTSLQQAIGSVLSKMSSEKALSAIQSKMTGKESLYYPTLSYIASPTAFEIVKVGIDKGNEAAVNAALAWSGFEASKTLFELYKKRADDASLTAYIKLLGATKFNDTQKLIYLRNALAIAGTAVQKNILLNEIGKCNTFNALLLAGQYLDNPATQHAAGTAVMSIAIKDKEYKFWSEQEREILEKFLAVRGGGDAPYDKEAIKKYLAEAPSVVGFVSAFNGKDLSGWRGLVQNPIARAKMKPAELAAAQAKADQVMAQEWKVADGELQFTGKGENICTAKPYGDFEMYVDWRIGKHGDSGIYLRGSPQVQIWDTTLTRVGAEVGSGGLYNNQQNPSKPLVLADNAIGEWNTFYIKMVGERVTVILNGVKVVDNVILENYWDRKQPIFPVEQIELQAHGDAIAFRDIYIKELPQAKPFELSAQEKSEGFKVLFDGFSMHEWIGNTKDYVAEEGAITLYPKNGGGGNLYTKDEYTDFVFRFEFMLTPAANNGLGIRTPLEGDAAYVGNCELQILDSEHPVYKDLEIYQYHGSAYGIIPAKRGFLKPTGEWNYEEVEVKGTHVKVILNGTVIMEGDLAQASKNGTADHQDHPGLKNTKGHIGFLGHGSQVKFKNIRIKEL